MRDVPHRSGLLPCRDVLLVRGRSGSGPIPDLPHLRYGAELKRRRLEPNEPDRTRAFQQWAPPSTR